MSNFSSEQFMRELDRACTQFALSLTEQQRSLLEAYWQLFIKWNTAYNLSAIRDPEQILYKHLVDSLAVVPHFQQAEFNHVLDVGTGGGLPGIPLAICFPEKHFTLLDSAGKKMRFLFQVCQQLNLDNVTLENCRVEQLAREDGFDIITSRAFASIKKFTDITDHLLADKGEFWAMKGVFPKEELSEMKKHYIVVEHLSLEVPNVEGERCLIKLRRQHH